MTTLLLTIYADAIIKKYVYFIELIYAMEINVLQIFSKKPHILLVLNMTFLEIGEQLL